eukprot:TRINITY_DN398_c0_g1_i1.p1 TRINITY_DN398_c0_g1~~TRINITY_DN398_c0_g1_i1.p1  ORF type:complete len:347 (-),score=64.74 TRINITY_DN398_c0_g1_i1:70-1110(-)
MGDIKRGKALLNHEALKNSEVKGSIDYYNNLFSKEQKEGEDERKKNYDKLVISFYDLVTTFYEFAWGECFHFGVRFKGESFEASLARHEMYLAYRMGLQKGQLTLDLGCGVGGPARCIARFTEAKIVGVTISPYQIERAKILTMRARLEHLCSWTQADFLNLPIQDETFEAAYQIEASVHAPSRLEMYKEAFRVLKPGSYFGGYEWLMTEKYDRENPVHKSVKSRIERGNAIPALLEHPKEALQALKEAGFEIVEHKDVAHENDSETPWYLPLSAGWSLSGIKHTRIGRYLTNRFLYLLETFKLAPQGSLKTSDMLNDAAIALVEGGKLDIFTPMYFVLARKPLKA